MGYFVTLKRRITTNRLYNHTNSLAPIVENQTHLIWNTIEDFSEYEMILNLVRKAMVRKAMPLYGTTRAELGARYFE